MKVMFVIEGEGRGHMTQAVAIKELLEEYGHTVCRVLVGTNGKRPMDIFRKYFGDIVTFESPNFIYTNNRQIDNTKTVVETLQNIPNYMLSLEIIDRELQEYQPDIVINFFEPIFSIYLWLHKKEILKFKSFSVGHQFMFHHPTYPKKWKRFYFQRKMADYWTAMAGYGSTKLALSFYEASDYKDINVVPPILRKKLFEVDKIKKDGDYLLCYVINHDYVNEIKKSLRRHPIKTMIFCENADQQTKDGLDIEFHNLNGDLFLEKMAGCKYVVCTAGFECVSEARYLGKQVLMVPVRHHAEQFYNAIDASNQKIGIFQNRFTLGKLLKSKVSDNTEFRKWIDSYKNRFVKILSL